MTGLVFSAFGPAFLAEYQSWFADRELSRRLSFPDETWLTYLGQPHVSCWTVEDGDNGRIAVVQIDRDDDGTGYFDIAVKPDLRGRGIGKRILQALVEEHGTSFRALHATVEPDNLASIRLLERCGFRRSGVPNEDGFLEFRRPPV